MAGFSRKSPGPQPGARPVGASKRIAGCSARCSVKWGSSREKPLAIVNGMSPCHVCILCQPSVAHASACSSQSSTRFVHFFGHSLHSLVLVCGFCQAIQPYSLASAFCHSPYLDVGRSCSPSWFAVEFLQALWHAVKFGGEPSLKLGTGFLHAWCGAGLATSVPCPPLLWSVQFCLA